MRTILQIVGEAHLGVRPGTPEAADHVNALEAMSDDDLALELLTRTRTESGHAQSPLAALLDAVQHLGWANEPCELIFVATRQTPPHPQDTHRLAGLLMRAVPARARVDPEAAAFPVLTCDRTIEIDEFRLGSIVGRVATALRSVGDRDVTLALGAGATTLQIGVLLGCVTAGLRPTILELNRQDVPGGGALLQIETSVALQRWLARVGRYTALSATRFSDPRTGNAVAVLAAAASFDWPEARKLAHSYRRTVPPLPAFGAGQGDVAAWTAFAVRAWLAARDPFAYVWFIRLAQFVLDDLVRKHPALKDVLVPANGQCSDGRCCEDHSSVRIETLMRCPRINVACKRSKSTEMRTLGKWRDAIGPAWKKARSVRHVAIDVDLEPLAEFVAAHDFGPQPDGNLPGLPPLDAPRRGRGRTSLVLAAVGKRFWDDQGQSPPLNALMAAIGPNSTRVILLASAQTAGLIPSTGAFTDVVVVDDDGRSVDVALTALRSHLRETSPDLGAVHVAIGPGTQAMNVALLIGAVETAYEAQATLCVHQLLPGPRVSGATMAQQSVVETLPSPEVRELAPIAQLGGLLDGAIDRVDLALAVDLVKRAPQRWRDALLAPLETVHRAAFDPSTPWQQRLALARKAARVEPARGLLWATAIFDHAKLKDRGFGRRVGNTTLGELRNDFTHNHVSVRMDGDALARALEADTDGTLLLQLRTIRGDLRQLLR